MAATRKKKTSRLRGRSPACAAGAPAASAGRRPGRFRLRASRCGGQVGGAKARLDAERLLPEVIRKLLSITDPDVLLREVCRLANNALGADGVTLCLVDPTGRDLVVHEIVGKKLRATDRRSRLHEDEGIVGWVASHRKPLLVADVKRDKRYVEIDPRVRSEAAVPILAGGKVAGVLNFDSYRPGYFRNSDLSLLEFLSSQTAIALRMIELDDRARRWQDRMAALNNLSRLGGGVVPTDRMLQRVADAVRLTCGIDYAAIFQGDYDREEVVLLAQSCPTPLNISPGARQKFGVGVIGKSFALGEVVNVRDVNREPLYVAKVPGVFSEVCVPIRVGDNSIGILDAQARTVGAFTPDDVMFLETVARFLAPTLRSPATHSSPS